MNLRPVIFIILLVLALLAIGWISFQSGDHHSNVIINNDKVEADTSEFVEGSKEALQDVSDAIDESIVTEEERR